MINGLGSMHGGASALLVDLSVVLGLSSNSTLISCPPQLLDFGDGDSTDASSWESCCHSLTSDESDFSCSCSAVSDFISPNLTEYINRCSLLFASRGDDLRIINTSKSVGKRVVSAQTEVSSRS